MSTQVEALKEAFVASEITLVELEAGTEILVRLGVADRPNLGLTRWPDALRETLDLYLHLNRIIDETRP